MADGTPGGARLRLENPSESAGPWKADEKTSGKIWKIKGKVLTFAPATRQSAKVKFFERFTYTTSSTSIKEDIPSKKYLSSNKKGILG